MMAINVHTYQNGIAGKRIAGMLGRVAALVLGIALAVSVSAESPWTKISRVISPKPSARTVVKASVAAPAKLAVGEVPDENPAAAQSQAQLTTQTQSTSQTLATLLKDAPTVPAQKGVKGVKGVPEISNLGREVEENEALLATDLFKKPEILRLLGDQPRFIYDPADRPDPMLVPWVRRAAIFKELFASAAASLEAGQVDQALEFYQQILKMNDPRFTPVVQAKLAEIAGKQQADASKIAKTTQSIEEKIELPAWVTDNTTGVILAPGDNLCLVGEYMLHAGDALPNYPDIKVVMIVEKQVTYQIRNKTFDVKLPQEP